MSETTIHAQLVTVLENSGLFSGGSVVVNDQPAIESRSRQFAPYAIIETADNWSVNLPAADPVASITYQPLIRLVDFAGGKGEKVVLDAFRTLRDAVIAELVENIGGLIAIQPDGRIVPFPQQQDGPEPDCIAQGMVLTVTEYM
jgi:hypothetical protein